MHVQELVVKRPKRSYHYTQIRSSYRDKNGRPTSKLLASFADLTRLEIDNLKAAVAASREGKAVVLADEVAFQLAATRVRANLRYLAIAVARSIWHQLQLSDILDDLLPKGAHDVAPSSVVEALTLHRCVDPDSKLAAQRWYPTTALPELQHVAPGKLNNTRVHHVLSELERVEDQLQHRLGKHIEARVGAFVTFFCDVTDAHFVGRGPDMAHKARTKEGLYLRKIGIALMCDQHGYPICWKTVAGSYREADLMGQLIDEIASLGWLQQAPVVVDRAMGQASTIEILVDAGVRFATGIPVNEFDSYTDRIPYQPLVPLTPGCTDASFQADAALARRAAEDAGLVRVDDQRYVFDLGIVDKGEHLATPSLQPTGDPQDAMGLIAAALRVGRRMRVALADGKARSLADLGRQHNCSPATAKKYLVLTDLREDLQLRIQLGEAEGCGLKKLGGVAALDNDEQPAAFERLLAEAKRNPTGGRRPRLGGPAVRGPAPLAVRLVVHFNPERFVRARRTATEQCAEVADFVAKLNDKLRSPRSRRTEASILGEVEEKLRRRGLLAVHKVCVDDIGERGKPSYAVRLRRDDEAWAKLRRYDGFNLLVTSADLPYGPAEVIELYFAKDAVEKDFQTIKSEFDLHPIRHRTDGKVRAHVTLCMLALLLERTLERRFAEAGIHRTAPSCFETLSTCHLNQMVCQWAPAYTVTELNADQRALLTALHLLHLADDTAVAEAILPR